MPAKQKWIIAGLYDISMERVENFSRIEGTLVARIRRKMKILDLLSKNFFQNGKDALCSIFLLVFSFAIGRGNRKIHTYQGGESAYALISHWRKRGSDPNTKWLLNFAPRRF